MTEKKSDTAAEGWVASGSFLGSILSGFVIGYLLDAWWDTGPWLVVIGILVGSYSGFVRMWQYAKKMDDGPDYDRVRP